LDKDGQIWWEKERAGGEKEGKRCTLSGEIMLLNAKSAD